MLSVLIWKSDSVPLSCDSVCAHEEERFRWIGFPVGCVDVDVPPPLGHLFKSSELDEI